MNQQVGKAESAERFVENRDYESTAAARCGCYAIFSDLTASPHDVEPLLARGKASYIIDGLPYSLDVQWLLDELRSMDMTQLKFEYSGIFEVGNDGPPVPIREDLQLGQLSGLREDIVRFYDFFDYGLDEKFAWAPDHLSVELEFMHYLCYQEASGAGDILSFQLGQADFAERHLNNWVPKLAANVKNLRPNSFYCRVTEALREFLATDIDWQAATIKAAGTESEC